jgi:hypothetical protein
VEIEPRPNTRPPDTMQMVELTSERLEQMSAQDIVIYAYHHLGVALDHTKPLTKLRTELMNLATDASNH